MKREAQQLSGGQLTSFIILKLQQYYERSPAFMMIFNVDSRTNTVDKAQQAIGILTHTTSTAFRSQSDFLDVRTFAVISTTRTSMNGIYLRFIYGKGVGRRRICEPAARGERGN
jgi:hypothetical protein